VPATTKKNEPQHKGAGVSRDDRLTKAFQEGLSGPLNCIGQKGFSTGEAQVGMEEFGGNKEKGLQAHAWQGRK